MSENTHDCNCCNAQTVAYCQNNELPCYCGKSDCGRCGHA